MNSRRYLSDPRPQSVYALISRKIDLLINLPQRLLVLRARVMSASPSKTSRACTAVETSLVSGSTVSSVLNQYEPEAKEHQMTFHQS